MAGASVPLLEIAFVPLNVLGSINSIGLLEK